MSYPTAASRYGSPYGRLAARAPPSRAPERSDPVRRGAGWYRGDLHAHTFHSDAEGSPQVLHGLASALGLDYLAVTDHNTVTAWDYFAAASSPELVFVPGMEITTYQGHANALGVREWIDFRIRTEDDLTQLAAEVRQRGALLSVNHDKPPMPWAHPEPDMACMEVWQRHWWARNEASLARYDERIRRGRRITLIGGSDYHTPARPLAGNPFGLGCPTTVVWLEELSIAGLITGLARGRVYVTESPDGPHVEIRTHGVPMGGVARAANRLVVDVEVCGRCGRHARAGRTGRPHSRNRYRRNSTVARGVRCPRVRACGDRRRGERGAPRGCARTLVRLGRAAERDRTPSPDTRAAGARAVQSHLRSSLRAGTAALRRQACRVERVTMTGRTFRGTLSDRDVKRHIPHVFQVPDGAARGQGGAPVRPRDRGRSPQHDLSLPVRSAHLSRCPPPARQSARGRDRARLGDSRIPAGAPSRR